MEATVCHETTNWDNLIFCCSALCRRHPLSNKSLRQTVQYHIFSLHPFLSLLSLSIPPFSPFLFFFHFFSTGIPVHAELMNTVIIILLLCWWYVWAITVLKVFRSPDSCTSAAAPMPLIEAIYSSRALQFVWSLYESLCMNVCGCI